MLLYGQNHRSATRAKAHHNQKHQIITTFQDFELVSRLKLMDGAQKQY